MWSKKAEMNNMSKEQNKQVVATCYCCSTENKLAMRERRTGA